MDTDHKIVLRTKILIPNLPETIVRQRLNPLFEEIRTKRVVIVVAGAGYGKTTLVAQTCRKLNTDVVWYSLSSFDSDFVYFIYYLITGIRQHYPDFGQKTLQRIESAQTIREKETVLTYLLKELEESIKNELIIVLDDLHFVQDNPEIKETLVFLMKYLPDMVHLALISRKTPDLNLSGFIARRETILIDEKALAFDVQEIEDFYQRLFGISLSPKILEILQAKTEGWVSGLILFQHSFQGRNQEEIEARLGELRGTSRMIFNFLEENVYGLLPGEIKEFLLKTSILSRLDISFCNRYLEKHNAREILEELEGKHLFTFPFDEQRESWYYHHLFKDYLLEKLGVEFGEKEIADLHTSAGQIWEDSGEPEEALNHYLEAGLYKQACQLLNQLGRDFIRGGRINLFLSYFRKMPDEFKEKEPWLYYTYGRALELHGKSREASRAFEQACGLFVEQGISKGVGLALNRLSSYYYTIGDFQKAEAVLKEIVTGIQGMPRLYANALGNLIFVTSHIAKFEEADKYYEESLRLFGEMINRDLQAWIYINNGFRYFTSGDLAEALDFGNKGIRMSESTANDDLLSYGYHLLSISNYYQGDFAEGLELALKGIRLGEKKGFRGMNHVWHFINACSCAATAGDMGRAMEYGETGLKICQEIESPWSEAWAYLSLCITHQKAGHLEKAEQCARAAVFALESLFLPGDEGMMKSALASILLEQGQLEEVEDLLVIAEKRLEGSKLNQSRVYLYLARYYWENQEMDKALNKLSTGLGLSEQNNYDYWIVEEKHWVMPLLVDLHSKGQFRDYLNKLFPKFGSVASEELNKIKRSENIEVKKSVESILSNLTTLNPIGLRVFCFGVFKLFRGDEEIPVEAWKSEKARMLFKYLVYHQGKGYIVKDILMELLWPESDPEKSRKRFNVALTAIRKILEPELARGTPSAYLLRKGDGYRLHLGENGFLDIAAFESAVGLAGKENDPDKALEHYLQAEALYKGDLFQEDQYQEWCLDARSLYREKYLHVLGFLVSFFKKSGDLVKAIEYARKYLEVDQYAENIYQMLMKMYQQTNNKILIKKTYEEARQKLEVELECPLSEETEKLYKELVSA